MAINVQFKHSTDLSAALDEVKQRVANIRNLPPDIEPPVVHRLLDIKPIASVIISGNGEVDELIPLVRNFERDLYACGVELRISVRREGLVSSWLHDEIRPGDLLECRSPRDSFVVDATTKRPLVLLGAGVGMTPLLSMLRHLVWEGMRTRGMRPTWLVQAARTAQSRPFDKEIHALAEIAGNALSIARVLSAPEPESAGSRTHEVTGQVSTELLKDLLPFDDYDFMICGPGSFVQALYDDLRAMRIPNDRIHTEAFSPSTLQRRFYVLPAKVVTQASTVSIPV